MVVSRGQTTFFLLYWGGKRIVDQLNQKLLFSIPDPIFSRPNVKKNSGLATRDYFHGCLCAA